MTKNKNNKKEPKVGEDLTEPLSAAEQAEREAEAKKDAEATTKPKAAKKGLLSRAKEQSEDEKIEDAATKEVEAAELEELKAKLQQVIDAGPIAAELSDVALQKGFTGQSSNLKMIAEACKQLNNRLAKEKDFLTYTKKGK